MRSFSVTLLFYCVNQSHSEKIEVMVGSPPLLVLAFCVACIFGQLFGLAQAQNQTDPAEGVPLYLSSHIHTQFVTCIIVLG